MNRRAPALAALAVVWCASCAGSMTRFRNLPHCPSGSELSETDDERGLGCYRGNVPNGPFVFFDDDGNVEAKVTFEDGRMNGTFTYFYPNGATKFQTNVVDGKFEGRLVVWHENGRIAKLATHRHDVLNGPYEERRSDGSPVMRGQFVDGKKEGVWTFYPASGGAPVTRKYSRDRLVVPLLEMRPLPASDAVPDSGIADAGATDAARDVPDGGAADASLPPEGG